jgi:hypothetical protein
MNKKIKGQYRQGDVLIQRVAKLSKKHHRRPINGLIVLADGEVTGHAHTIGADAADWWQTADGDNEIEVKTATEVKHQEHGPIPLEARPHISRRQREYAPEAIRTVLD